MIPAFARHYGWVAVTLASAVIVVGCGGGGATDDAVKIISGTDEVARAATPFSDDGERALPGLTTRLQQPTSRLRAGSGTPPRLEAQRSAEEAVQAAFCEGWAIYKTYGAFPSSDEWYDILARRLQSFAFRYPAAVSQVISVYDTAAYAVETGDLAGAQLDLACRFR